MILYVINAILALIGGYVIFSFFRERQSSDKIQKFYNSDNNIIDSKFSKFFGIKIEYVGFLYYIIILIGYLISAFVYKIFGNLQIALFIISLVGFGFSAYLTMIQIFYIKNWSRSCVVSFLINALIAYISCLTISGNGEIISRILLANLSIIQLWQLIAISAGVATATISGFLTVRFLKDFQIDQNEDKKLTTLENIIWVAIVILGITNLCLYLISPNNYFESPKLFSQIFFFIVLLINNILLTLMFGPKLVGIRIDMKSINVFRTFLLRQTVLALGVISVVSWYAILLATFFSEKRFSDGFESVGYFVAITLIIIIISQFAILLVDKIRTTRDNKYRFR